MYLTQFLPKKKKVNELFFFFGEKKKVNELDSDSYLFNVSFVQYKRGFFFFFFFLMGKEVSFTYAIFSLEN